MRGFEHIDPDQLMADIESRLHRWIHRYGLPASLGAGRMRSIPELRVEVAPDAPLEQLVTSAARALWLQSSARAHDEPVHEGSAALDGGWWPRRSSP